MPFLLAFLMVFIVALPGFAAVFYDVFDLKDMEFLESKKNGINVDDFAGIYRDKNGVKWMVKPQESGKNEFLASVLLKIFVPKQIPEIRLVKDLNGRIMTASRFIDNFITAADYCEEYDVVETRAEDAADLSAALKIAGVQDNHDWNNGYILDGWRTVAARVDLDRAFCFDDENSYVSALMACENEHTVCDVKDIAKSLERMAQYPDAILVSELKNAQDYLKKNMGRHVDITSNLLKHKAFMGLVANYTLLDDENPNDVLNFSQKVKGTPYERWFFNEARYSAKKNTAKMLTPKRY